MNEQNNNQETQANENAQGAAGENEQATVESLLKEIAQLKAEAIKTAEKNKATLDKVLAENGQVKRQLREKQTTEELEAEAKKAQEEAVQNEINELKAFKAEAMAFERYSLQGMDSDTAKKAAKAEVAGDMDLLSSIQKQFLDAKIKEKEAEWIKNRPQVNAGTGDGASYTVEQFGAMGLMERNNLYKSNPEEYARLQKLESGGK